MTLKGLTGLVQHFPASIPPTVTNIRFSESPGFLQGGAHIQLRLWLPPDEIARSEAGLRQAAIRTFSGGRNTNHSNDAKEYFLVPPFHTADDPEKTSDFPDHYMVFLLHARDYSNQQGVESWNHGEACGAAVSTTANEVVYWAEAW